MRTPICVPGLLLLQFTAAAADEASTKVKTHAGSMADIMAGDRQRKPYESLADAAAQTTKVANDMLKASGAQHAMGPNSGEGVKESGKKKKKKKPVSLAQGMGSGPELPPEARKALTVVMVASIILLLLRLALDPQLRARIRQLLTEGVNAPDSAGAAKVAPATVAGDAAIASVEAGGNERKKAK
eukprot:gnl/TRDRNA2_/TRDRNA2_196624_c0_seq1.p1 gnl/TRDRNA2_/TRDRNA2_196624_c0~~gnl/TRDRNA2_/TRDRNA2_196624_c0_seq1.p1  ORF type:complete len:185 (+),score=50.71 gnl/TRDRNA2_/TRDRNA2_196624_c0_seq1:64-618(+)